MQKDYIGTINAQQSERFGTKLISVAHALRANKHDLSVIEVIKLHERVDMKHENITIAESRAEQSRVRYSLPWEYLWFKSWNWICWKCVG